LRVLVWTNSSARISMPICHIYLYFCVANFHPIIFPALFQTLFRHYIINFDWSKGHLIKDNPFSMHNILWPMQIEHAAREFCQSAALPSRRFQILCWKQKYNSRSPFKSKHFPPIKIKSHLGSRSCTIVLLLVDVARTKNFTSTLISDD
jgi:hypothetical protein